MAQPEDDGREMEIWPAALIGGQTPPEMSTGDDEDDEILRQIAARTSLDLPRDCKHFLLVPDEAAAEMAAGPLTDIGWEVTIGYSDGDDDGQGPAWCVFAEVKGVVLTPAFVRSTREMFEKVAAAIPGAEYDGWQASMTEDEILQHIPPATDAPDE
jgi:Regulator of ribonuclease activity B